MSFRSTRPWKVNFLLFFNYCDLLDIEGENMNLNYSVYLHFRTPNRGKLKVSRLFVPNIHLKFLSALDARGVDERGC